MTRGQYYSFTINDGPIEGIKYDVERSFTEIILRKADGISAVREVLDNLHVEFTFVPKVKDSTNFLDKDGMNFFKIQKLELTDLTRSLRKAGLITAKEMHGIQRYFLTSSREL